MSTKLDIDSDKLLTSEGEPIYLQIPAHLAGNRIDNALAQIIPELSRSKIINWIKAGYILVNSSLTKPKDKIFGGEEVVIWPQVSTDNLAFTPQDIPLDIVYEDEHLLVINKPQGLTVHPGNGNWSGTLLNGLLHHYPALINVPRAGIVHRLDKDTTGLMVVAKNLHAQTNLVAQLQSRQVSRVYRAIVEGHVAKQGTIAKNIGRDPINRIKMTTLEIGGKEAVTHYNVLQYFNQFSYIECSLETGRTHQIRVHMKSINHPIIGDRVYGKTKTNYSQEILDGLTKIKRQCLHAIKLSFKHPHTNEIVEFKIPLAKDIEELLKILRKYDSNSPDLEDDFDLNQVETYYVK